MLNKKVTQKTLTLIKAFKESEMSVEIKTLLISFLVFILLLLPTAASARKTEDNGHQNTKTILQKIKELCNKYPKKKAKPADALDEKGMHQLKNKKAKPIHIKTTIKGGSEITGGLSEVEDPAPEVFMAQKEVVPPQIESISEDKQNEIILDGYQEINNLYAYDPDTQKWVQIKKFNIVRTHSQNKTIDQQMDWTLYTDFWAYNVTEQEWHKVTLMKYLQQTNTQLNNLSLPMSTKELDLLDTNSKADDTSKKEELLEELLGVHTIPIVTDSNLQQEDSIWSNCSFDFSLGIGVVFYENSLVNMRLVTREDRDHFFITKTNEVYKPNWFYNALDKVNGFDINQMHHVAHGRSHQITFKGKGSAWPITLGMQYIFWQQLLVGIGREIVLNYTNNLLHNDTSMQHNTLTMPKKWSTQGRWFAKGGWYFFRNPKHRLLADIRIFCVHHLGNRLRKTITFGSYLHRAYAFNLGGGYEQQLTNYLSFTSRLSMEWQRFTQFSNQECYNINYKQPAIYLQMGLSIQLAKNNASKKTKSIQNIYTKRKVDDLSKLEEMQDLLDLY